MGAVVWLNGTLCDEAEARLSPFDHGLLVGDGVFETLFAPRGEPFSWTRHYDRLCRSAAALGFAPPSSDPLLEGSRGVLDANGLTERPSRVRVTVTSGPGPLGSDRGDQGLTTFIAAAEQAPFAPTTDVIVVRWPRNERGALAGLKTTSYAENARAVAAVHEQGAGEAIFANTQGDLCEGTSTNIYLVHGGRVATPPLSSGCLDGVTRQLLLELAPSVGIEIREVDLPVNALAQADEAFLSSSTRGAQPIAKVDGTALAAAPGPVTQKLAGAYADLLDREIDP